MRPKNNHFTIVSNEKLVAAARALGCEPLLVYLYAVYQHKLTHRDKVDVTNYQMHDWGVSRKQKSRALQLLEEAGLIRIERNGNRSPKVTVL